MIIRPNAKTLIKDFVSKAADPLTGTVLNAWLLRMDNENPLLQIAAEVMDALNQKNYDHARHVLHQVADFYIDQIEKNNSENLEGK